MSSSVSRKWKGSICHGTQVKCHLRVFCSVSVGSWSLKVLPMCQAASLTLPGTHHMERDASALWFRTFLSEKSLSPLGGALDWSSCHQNTYPLPILGLSPHMFSAHVWRFLFSSSLLELTGILPLVEFLFMTLFLLLSHWLLYSSLPSSIFFPPWTQRFH